MSTTRIITLGQYIELLENLCDVHGKDFKIPLGFGEPISWRGNYQDLALPSKHNTTLGRMLIDAQSAVGEVMTGYKGGEYLMTLDTLVYVDEYSSYTPEEDQINIEGFLRNIIAAQLSQSTSTSVSIIGTKLKPTRPQLPPLALQDALSRLQEKTFRRLDQKGYGAFASNHEILGIIRQETDEYSEAVHKRLSNAEKIEELLDIAVGCIIGIATLQNDFNDW